MNIYRNSYYLNVLYTTQSRLYVLDSLSREANDFVGGDGTPRQYGRSYSGAAFGDLVRSEVRRRPLFPEFLGTVVDEQEVRVPELSFLCAGRRTHRAHDIRYHHSLWLALRDHSRNLVREI